MTNSRIKSRRPYDERALKDLPGAGVLPLLVEDAALLAATATPCADWPVILLGGAPLGTDADKLFASD